MRPKNPWTLAFVAALAIGAGLRILALNNDLWLDEVWSILFAEGSMDRPGDVLFSPSTRHSNNHPLNTLYLFLVGHHASPVPYRLLSLFSGIGLIAIAWAYARRRDEMEGAVVAGLTATSFLLIEFSTEARGYAPMLLFAMLGALLLRAYLDSGGWSRAVGFWTCSLLGLLSHLSYVYVLISAGAWSVVALARERGGSVGRMALRLVRLHVVPALGCVFLWVVFVRGLAALNPGDPETGPGSVIVRACSLTMGGPSSGPVAAAVCVVFVIVLLRGLALERRDGTGPLVFYGFLTLVAPLLVLAQRDRVYSRMFLLPSLFFLLLFGRVLVSMLRSGRVARTLAIAALTLYVGGNLANTAGLVRHGRGEYRAALRYMAENTAGPIVSMTSDNDHRVGLVVAYHRQFVTVKRFDYLPEASVTTPPPWYIRDRGEIRGEPPPRLRFLGADYEWVRTFRYSGVSGRNWLVYRLASDGPIQPG